MAQCDTRMATTDNRSPAQKDLFSCGLKMLIRILIKKRNRWENRASFFSFF